MEIQNKQSHLTRKIKTRNGTSGKAKRKVLKVSISRSIGVISENTRSCSCERDLLENSRFHVIQWLSLHRI